MGLFTWDLWRKFYESWILVGDAIFFTACREHFDFLISEYGFRAEEEKNTQAGVRRVSFTSKNVSITIFKYLFDDKLHINIYNLRPQGLSYPLELLLENRAPGFHLPMIFYRERGWKAFLDATLPPAAEALRKYAKDCLQGDTGNLSQVKGIWKIRRRYSR